MPRFHFREKKPPVPDTKVTKAVKGSAKVNKRQGFQTGAFCWPDY
jgi:hypothetical protein